MGTFTPFIGLYIPAAGETNYEASFAAGMMNLDVHDHSGAPNKGVPITSSGLGDFSVTFEKLAADVADNTTGIGTNSTPGSQNQLQLLGVLKNLYALALASGNGFLAINGQAIAARTFQDTATTHVNNPSGGGNPSIDVLTSGIFPVDVADGGTGKTTFAPYDIILGGSLLGTDPLQQVSGEGTIAQVLTSQGPLLPPIWSTPGVIPPQTVFQATVTMTAAQFTDLVANPVQIVAHAGPGIVIVPITAYGKLNFSGSAFSSGSAVYLGWGSSLSKLTNVRFDSGTFKDTYSGYYLPTFTSPSTSGIALTSIEDRGLYIGVNSSDFSSGGASTVTITVFYTLISI